MARKTFARRPTKAMMLTVNAAIDGDKATVDKLIKEHDLDCAELEQRLGKRNGRKYELQGQKKKRQKAAHGAKHFTRTRVPEIDFDITIDGRTSVAKLFKIIDGAERIKAQAQQELKRRPLDEIEPVKKALSEIELLRRERDKLEEKIRATQEALG